jgi:hypothetical protein
MKNLSALFSYDYIHLIDPPTGDVPIILTHIGSTGGVIYVNGAGAANGVEIQGYDRCVKVYNVGGSQSILLDGDTGAVICEAINILSLTGSTVPQFKLDDPDVTTSFTGLPGSLSTATANTVGLVQGANTSNGGMLVAGLRSSGGTALSFQSHQGSAQTAAGIILAGYKTDGGTSRTDLATTEIIVSINAGATNVYNFLAQGTLLINTGTIPTGQTTGIVLGGGTSTPVLGAATADIVSIAGVDNGAANRELQVQPESGGIWAWGANVMRRVFGTGTASNELTQARTTTTSNAVTTLATIPIAASYTYLIDVKVTARRTGGSAGTADDGATYWRKASYTTKAAVVTLMGAVQTIGTDTEDQAGWDCTLTISTTNVLVRVTGATNNNITWTADISVQRVSS